MTNLNDGFMSVLSRYPGSVDDKRVAYLRDYLGLSKGQLNDLEFELLGRLGFSGSLNDRWLAHIRTLGGNSLNSLGTFLSSSFYVGYPSGLFQNSEVGAWYDPSDLTTLFQDSAGTTPVTTTGQPVARMNDKSGNGIHAVQSGASSLCPTYQVDSGGRPYLSFDGVDDFLVTSTITPNADKVQVFAGLRKLADTPVGMAVELSSSVLVNNGAFNLAFPGVTATASARSASRGTINSQATYTDASIAAPSTRILTSLGDISGDTTTLRVNGTQVAQNTADQGTGNYLAYPMYLGRRGGATAPFVGNYYGLIVRFSTTNLDAAVISQIERWLGQKTGVTF